MKKNKDMTDSKDRAFYQKGFDLSIQNSKSLLKVAEKSAECGEFGIACSLNVLSAEEAVKACLILFELNNYSDQKNKDFPKIFSDHKFKHNLIKDLIEFVSLVSNSYKKENISLDQIVEQIEGLPEEYKSNNKINSEKISKLKYILENEIIKYEEFEDAMKWCQNANDLKKNGFYVGLNNNEWLSPQEISKTQFETDKKFTASLLNWVQIFEITFIALKFEMLILKNSSDKLA